MSPEVRVVTAGVDEGRRVRAALRVEQLGAVSRAELAPGCSLESFDVELGLLVEAVLQELDQPLVVDDAVLDLGGAELARDLVRDEGVDFRVLRLLEPVVVEEFLEERVDHLGGFDALDVVLLRHPLDVEDQQGDAELRVLEHRVGDVARRSDDVRAAAEARAEGAREALEELDVLGFFAGELEERPDLVILRVDAASRVVEDEGEDELLDEPEEAEVAVPRSWFKVRRSSPASIGRSSVPARASGRNGRVKSSSSPGPSTSSSARPLAPTPSSVAL